MNDAFERWIAGLLFIPSPVTQPVPPLDALARFIGWRVRRGVVLTGPKRTAGACALVEEWTAPELPISRDVETVFALTGAALCLDCGANLYGADPLDRQRKPRGCPLCEVAR